MSNTKTPGQVCYDGFWRTTHPDFRDDWPTLPPSAKARWEAAAQAVLTQYTPLDDPCPGQAKEETHG